MKHILTLLVSVTLVATAFAQKETEREKARRIILGDKKGSASYPKTEDRGGVFGGEDRTVYGDRDSRYPERYPTTSSTSRERRISEINRAYDAKIYSIRRNPTLSRTEKERIIRELEYERRRELAQINDRYHDNNRRNDREEDCEDNKKNKSNNGNKYGWQKGKGNPHRGK